MTKKNTANNGPCRCLNPLAVDAVFYASIHVQPAQDVLFALAGVAEIILFRDIQAALTA